MGLLHGQFDRLRKCSHNVLSFSIVGGSGSGVRFSAAIARVKNGIKHVTSKTSNSNEKTRFCMCVCVSVMQNNDCV